MCNLMLRLFNALCCVLLRVGITGGAVQAQYLERQSMKEPPPPPPKEPEPVPFFQPDAEVLRKVGSTPHCAVPCNCHQRR